MSCQIKRNKITNEIISVSAPNGAESVLFKDALSKTKNKENALGYWSQAYTPGFIDWYGDWEIMPTEMLDENGEPRLTDVEQYLNQGNKSYTNAGEFVNSVLAEFGDKYKGDGVIKRFYFDDVSNMVEDFNRTNGRKVKFWQDPDGIYRIGVMDDALESAPISPRDTLAVTLNKLSAKFNIPYEFDTSLPFAGTFTKSGVVKINPNLVQSDTAFHEFAHPFVLAIKQENPKLYERLVRQIKSEKTILEQVRTKYTKHYESQGLSGQSLEDTLIEEAIVTALGSAATIEHNRLKTALQKFIDWINRMIKAILPKRKNELFNKINSTNYKILRAEVLSFIRSNQLINKYDFISKSGNTLQALYDENSAKQLVNVIAEYPEIVTNVLQRNIAIRNKILVDYQKALEELGDKDKSKNYKKVGGFIIKEGVDKIISDDTSFIDKVIDTLTEVDNFIKLGNLENLTINDLAKIMIDDSSLINLSSVRTTADLRQISERERAIYGEQMKNASKEAKLTAEGLMSMDALITDVTDKHYILGRDTKLRRATDVMKEDPYYAFDGDVTPYIINRQWGDATDSILSHVILGTPLEEVIKEVEQMPGGFNQSLITGLYNEFTKVRQDFPDSIILTQVTFFNRKKGVAGTADVVVVKPDGRIKIIDLKSSINAFVGTYKTEGGFNNNYAWEFTQAGGVKKASRKGRHTYQVSMYGAMAESQGFVLDDNPLFVLPIHLKDRVGNTIGSFERETDYIDLIYLSEVQKQYGEDYSGKAEKIFEPVINNIYKILKERINANKANGKNTYYEEQLLEALKEAADIEAANRFINEAYTTFVEGTGDFPGLMRMYKRLLDKAVSAEDKLEIVKKIGEIEQLIEIYANPEYNVIEELHSMYVKFKNAGVLEDSEIEVGSPLYKLKKVREAFAEMRADFKDRVPSVIAEVLVEQVSPSVVENIKRQIKEKKEKLKNLKPTKTLLGKLYKGIDKKIFESSQRKLQRDLDELVERFSYDPETDEVDMKRAIEAEIKVGGYKDINLVDRWLTPAVSIDNTFLPTFVLTLKAGFEEVRERSRIFLFKAHDEFKKYDKATSANKDFVESFNKGMYTEREVVSRDLEGKIVTTKIAAFTSPIDYGKYHASYKAMMEEQDKTEDVKEKGKIYKRWREANTEVRPESHVEGVTMFKGLKLIETRKDMISRKKKELGANFNYWLSKNRKWNEARQDYDYYGEFLMPKSGAYKSAEFQELLKDKDKFNYFKFLMSTYLKAQKRLPVRHFEHEKFILPFITKSDNDRLAKLEVMDMIKYKAKDAFFRISEDYNEESMDNTRTIPVLYYNAANPMESNDVSKDLITSMLRFNLASLKHQTQTKFSPLADNLLTLVRGTSPSMSDSEGYKLLSRAASQVGIEGGMERYKLRHGENNIAALLEAFIDTHIYGRRRKDKPYKLVFGTIDLGKIADSIIRFGSLTQIAADPLTGAANALQGRVMAAIESAAGEYYNRKTWRQAYVEYTKQEANFLKDTLSPLNKSKIGQLIDLYDPLQGEHFDEYGRRLSKSAFKQKFDTSLGYSMMHKGEHWNQVTSMIAMLKTKKVKQTLNGITKEIDLYDAYTMKDGKLALKEGVEMESLKDRDLQNSLHAINKRLHGVYNNLDAPDIQRHWYGRLLMMYRKFLAPGLKKRFKAEGLDYELGDFTKGTYRVFYKKLFLETLELFKALSGQVHTMTPYELANVRRAFYEHVVLFSTGVLVKILGFMISSAEPEEKAKYHYALYLALRLNSELSIYGAFGDPTVAFLPNIKEMQSPYRTPTVAFSVLAKATNLYTQAADDLVSISFGGEIARYKRDTGVFKKGDSKLWAKLMKLIGISGKNLDPEMAVDVLVLQKGTK